MQQSTHGCIQTSPNMHPSRSSMHPRFDMDAFNASHSEGNSHSLEDDDTEYFPSVRISHFSTPTLYGGHGRNPQSYSGLANPSAFSTPLDTSSVYLEASNRTDYHYWNTDSARYAGHGLPTPVNPICLYCQQGFCSINHHVNQTFPANVESRPLFSPSIPSPHHWSPPQHHFTYPGQVSSGISGVGRASTSFEGINTLYRHTSPPTSHGLPLLPAQTNLLLTQETVASPRDTCDCDCDCEDGEYVPQRPWIPVNGSPLEDMVHNSPVTFDVGEKSGILAVEALEKKFGGLVGRDDYVLRDCGSSISLRLEVRGPMSRSRSGVFTCLCQWPGYDAWTKQVRS